MEGLLPRGDGYQRSTVARRKWNVDGELIILCNANPILDTRVYEAVFSDKEGLEISSNQVAESIITSCDSEGSEFIIFRDIHRLKRAP